MLSMHIKYEEFNGFYIEQNFQLVLRLCTICSQNAKIISPRNTHNVCYIYTDKWRSKNFKENVAGKS